MTRFLEISLALLVACSEAAGLAAGNSRHGLLPGPATDPAGQVTTYAYDDAGRLETVTDPLDHTTTYAYDAAGRLETVTDPLDHTTTYGYDWMARQASVTNALDETASDLFDTAALR